MRFPTVLIMIYPFPGHIVLYSRTRASGFPEGQGRKNRDVNILLSDILKLREYKIVK